MVCYGWKITIHLKHVVRSLILRFMCMLEHILGDINPLNRFILSGGILSETNFIREDSIIALETQV